MASPMVRVRLPERLHARVLEAASAEGVTVSKWLRQAALERLGAASSTEAERVALLAEARQFIAAHRDGGYEVPIVERLAGFLELVDGRISKAEQRGRARALAEIADGALTSLSGDGEVIELADFRLRDERDLPVVLEAQPPRRRGFLRLRLVEEHARALLAAPEPSPAPSAAGLLGEQATKDLWAEAVSWPGVRRVFCATHGMVPCAPSSEGRQCYLKCTIPSAPEVA